MRRCGSAVANRGSCRGLRVGGALLELVAADRKRVGLRPPAKPLLEIQPLQIGQVDRVLETADRLASVLTGGESPLEVVPWTELRPEMVEYVSLIDSFYLVIFVVVFLIAMFGVANTMLMATFERRREFAVMLALGTTPSRIVLAVLYEAVGMGVISLMVGAAITFPLMSLV